MACWILTDATVAGGCIAYDLLDNDRPIQQPGEIKQNVYGSGIHQGLSARYTGEGERDRQHKLRLRDIP